MLHPTGRSPSTRGPGRRPTSARCSARGHGRRRRSCGTAGFSSSVAPASRPTGPIHSPSAPRSSTRPSSPDPPRRGPPGGYHRPMTTTHTVPGAILTEREHTVPLDHAAPDGPTISVFTREVADPDARTDTPYLLFLQGGPGIEATRPTSPPSGWMVRALRDFRVLLLDQRGTGRSTPVGTDIPGDTAEDQAAYLTHFRADSIVRDAEAIRRTLGIDRGRLLGQSFGGFTSMTYLSIAPEGLREAFITGGVAPIGRSVDDVYARTYGRVIDMNERYYTRYPEDRARVREIHRRLEAEPYLLETGERLTRRRFRQIGLWLGD